MSTCLSLVDLSTSVANIHLQTPLWNASGVMCTSVEELMAVVESEFTGAVVTKSCTISARVGNLAPRYAAFGAGVNSINSMGLPNHGFEYYLQAAKTLHIERAKPYFISLCGLTREENMEMLRKVASSDARPSIAGVELNLSCPNVVGKPQTCYDFDAMDETLRQTFELWGRHESMQLPLGVKLSPYFDPIHFDMAYDVLSKYPIKWITCINSIGNGLVIDPVTEQTLIHPKMGLGGIGGQAIKATALANVWSFHQRFAGKSVDIIGCGGVANGTDVFEHILCGASAVQVGTLLMERGVDAFRTLTEELTDVMRGKGYGCLADFRGKLRVAQR